MVSILDRIIRGLRDIPELLGFGPSIREDGGFGKTFEPTPDRLGNREEESTEEFTRKFVSGLFYCGGKKVQFFGLTFEQNGEERADDLLDAIEDVSGNTCSDLRDNFGYEAREVDSSEVRTGAIWPDIEVGEL